MKTISKARAGVPTIISRHPAAIEFLCRELAIGADEKVCVLSGIVKAGDFPPDEPIYGNVPLSLAHYACEVVAIEFRGAPPRGVEYSLADMDAAGAYLVRYQVVWLGPYRGGSAEGFVGELYDHE